MIIDTEPWMVDAKCGDPDVNPDWFFPEARGRSLSSIQRQVVDFCKDCPVIKECGLYALRTKQEFGVWGGMVEKDRRKLLRRRA